MQGNFYTGKLNSYKEIFYVCKCLRDSFLGRAKYEYHSIRFNSFVILVVPIGTGFLFFSLSVQRLLQPYSKCFNLHFGAVLVGGVFGVFPPNPCPDRNPAAAPNPNPDHNSTANCTHLYLDHNLNPNYSITPELDRCPTRNPYTYRNPTTQPRPRPSPQL